MYISETINGTPPAENLDHLLIALPALVFRLNKKAYECDNEH